MIRASAARLIGPRDFTASIVVFLVAMPLCMGIAIASGVPPERGLIAGIIGGIVVGALAGSPLQVSGPAAGLAVIVFELVRDKGLSALGPILVLAGAIQLAAGIARLGGWFRAISPAVVHGMLAGIGVLIVVGQFHVLFDARPLANGLANLAAMPERLLGLGGDVSATEMAFALGLLTIGTMLAWERWRPASLRLVPGALVGVVAATLAVMAFAAPVTKVAVPTDILAAIALPGDGFVGRLVEPGVWASALALAFVASAETLLSAAAVDRMHDGVRTDYDRELRAQGVGNVLCGLVGALPLTGVIVRSSANVQAGAESRRSAIMHGVWILAFVALLPFVLRQIPMAALAGVLVVTGCRLVNLYHVRHLFRHYGVLPALIWAATLVTVVVEDLLTGVLVGVGLSLIELIPRVRRLALGIDARHDDEASAITLNGAATFVTLPRLTRALDAVPAGSAVTLDLGSLAAIDHTTAEHLKEWAQRHRAGGGGIALSGDGGGLGGLVAA